MMDSRAQQLIKNGDHLFSTGEGGDDRCDPVVARCGLGEDGQPAQIESVATKGLVDKPDHPTRRESRDLAL